jgi:hypothetical protein
VRAVSGGGTVLRLSRGGDDASSLDALLAAGHRLFGDAVEPLAKETTPAAQPPSWQPSTTLPERLEQRTSPPRPTAHLGSPEGHA